MSIVEKYADPEAVARMTVSEVLEDMGELGAGKAQMIVEDSEGNALGGVILIGGPNADRYRAAVEETERLIEQEQESNE